MHIKQTPLYRTRVARLPKHLKVLIAALAFVAPVMAAGVSKDLPREQDFILTAYYSPLPGQCCYVKGGYRADKVLNGEGTNGADGTEVYPGMIAAPASYAFGTVVALPGIGRFAVHDRGGAITELEGGAHRLDIWVGHGEEGLARALAFGVRRVRGTVYEVGGFQPKVSFSLESFPAVLNRLEPFLVRGQDLLAVSVKAGDRGLSVETLQRSLGKTGFFDQAPTGLFGVATQDALTRFNAAYGLTEPSDHLSERSAATLAAAVRRADVTPPVAKNVDRSAKASVIRTAQRTMRFLGYYKGRTNGVYSDTLAAAILKFQQSEQLVGTAEDPGAGRIGPLTRGKLKTQWNQKLVADLADRLMILHRVEVLLDQKGKNLDQFLSEGDSGQSVTLLQRLLADRGYFPSEKVNGYFGLQTREAVLQYQIDRQLVAAEGGSGAGTVGPQTLKSLRAEEQQEAYLLVRSEGWRAL
ncbi:MAG: peptidoglycan-binding protein [Candidatus Peribacteraceae bacterium]|nr:peptidoglycan-binding protein [Candidatus Peribacteraceae bacterium]MDD5739214.1 peptidoglycan-binding protein [Candidatus Peribacteraceae bacterium]